MSLGTYMAARPHLFTEETRIANALANAQRWYPHRQHMYIETLQREAGLAHVEAARYWRMWLAERPGIGG